ncbi:regulatory protein GemA [Oceanicola sp. S124]|uniref:regulatory protein GemA n=1 Tax=Oceanicola sp. S124 TaxID=1042378 RepID=UPI0002558651|nr:regulatory protein GemA [Oceanicola sp. S124]
MSRTLQRTIFAGCRELGLDDDTRRDLQLGATGKASLSEMTEDELKQVIKALETRGFKRVVKSDAKRRPKAKRADVRFAHVLWRLLHENGSVRVAGPAGLNAFTRSQFEGKWGAVPMDIDMMTDWAQIADVIDALKAWCRRDGIQLKGEHNA